MVTSSCSVSFFLPAYNYFWSLIKLFLEFHFKDNKAALLVLSWLILDRYIFSSFFSIFICLLVCVCLLLSVYSPILIFYFITRDFSSCLRLSCYMTLILPYYFTFSITIISYLFFPVFHPRDMGLLA